MLVQFIISTSVRVEVKLYELCVPAIFFSKDFPKTWRIYIYVAWFGVTENWRKVTFGD